MHASHAELLRAADLPALGARLRAARIARGWTQGDLAAEDVSVGYISRIENGTRRPQLAVLGRLASRLEVPLEQLLLGMTTSQYDEIRLGLDYAELALETGETVEAEHQAREQLARAEAAAVAPLVARARFILARSLEALGELDDAIIELEQLVESADGPLIIEAGIALSRCYRETADLALAIEVGERLEKRIAEAGLESSGEAVQFAVNIAGAHIMRGDLHQASRICAEAVRRADELASPGARARAYWNASLVHAERGDIAMAAPLASRALVLLSEGNDARNLARLRAQLGALQLQLDPPEVEEARENLARAREEMVASSASEVDIALADVRIAQAHLLSGDPDLAFAMAAAAQESVGVRAAHARAEAMVLQGQALAALDRLDEARSTYVAAMHVLTAAGADRPVAQLWFELADLMERAGDLDSAREAYRNAAATTGLTARRSAVRQVPSRL